MIIIIEDLKGETFSGNCTIWKAFDRRKNCYYYYRKKNQLQTKNDKWQIHRQTGSSSCGF